MDSITESIVLDRKTEDSSALRGEMIIQQKDVEDFCSLQIDINTQALSYR